MNNSIVILCHITNNINIRVDCLFRMGGIIPPVARDLHEKHIGNVVNLALQRASVKVQVGFGFI